MAKPYSFNPSCNLMVWSWNTDEAEDPDWVVPAMQMTPWLSFDAEITTWGRAGYVFRFLLDPAVTFLSSYMQHPDRSDRILLVGSEGPILYVVEFMEVMEAEERYCWLIHAVRRDSLIEPAPPPPSEVGSVPIGAIVMWNGFIVPNHWAICNGSEVSRTGTFGELYTVIGTAFGVGNGTTTYNLPNYTGKFPRGWTSSGNPGSVRGDTGGAATTTLAIANLPPHGHQVPYSLNLGSSGTVRLGDAGTGGQFTTGLSNGLATPFSNEPPWLTTAFIIRYE